MISQRSAASAKTRRIVTGAILVVCLAWPRVGSCQLSESKPIGPDHAARMRRGLDLFQTLVRPLLLKHCLKCHGGEETEGGLSIATRKGVLEGGETGPAIALGKSQDSLLIRLIRHRGEPHMPKDSDQLPSAAIKAFEEWVDCGAPYDKPLVSSKRSPVRPTLTDPQRNFWSFRPLLASKPPAVRNESWPQSAVDRFLLARMEEKDLRPTAAASDQKVLRRLSLGLLGFPPSADDVQAFENDASPGAWERAVDRALANPRYGERWARHWLDVVRFAESYGFEHDLDNDHAYHFRDFVIRALNDDLPYDKFVRWQLAGDELAPGNPLARLATGFMAAGVRNADFAKIRVEQERYDELDDIISTTGVAFLGLSIGCARCHHHKYDPISQDDYYELAAAFERTIRGEVKLNGAPYKPAESVTALVAGEGLKPLPRIYNPGPAFLSETWLLRRGSPRLKLRRARAGVLEVLKGAADMKAWRVENEDDSFTYRRSMLARWLTDVEHGAGALLARVIVNRVWAHHFGQGIVATPNDFGARGARPTHPELLDHLAGDLIAHDWSLKHLHRRILNSAAYRQAMLNQPPSTLDRQLFRGWRRRRLEAEAIRDSMLNVSGRLDNRMFGPGSLDSYQSRRSIYFRVKRSQLMPMMTLFDAPDALQSTGRRTETTVATQALALINGPEIDGWSRQFARRLLVSARQSPRESVRIAFHRALGRDPTPHERRASLAFLARQQQEYSDTSRSNPQPAPGGLVLWLDPDTAKADADGRIVEWRDRRDGDGIDRPIVRARADAPRRDARPTPLGTRPIAFGPKPTIMRAAVHKDLAFGTADFSATTLFRVEPGGADNQIWGTDSFPGSGNSYTGFFLQHHDQRLRFATRDLRAGKGPVNYLDSRRNIANGRWYRVTAVRRASRLSMFFDDDGHVDTSMAERSPTDVNSNFGLKLGDIDEHASGAMYGRIAELLVYNRALTSAEVRQNHAYLSQRHLSKTWDSPLERALTDFCNALFCLDEFVYVD